MDEHVWRKRLITVVTGKVLRFDEVRGYGFIAPDDGGEDVFVHANDIVSDKQLLSSGVPVEFEVMEGDRGLKAFAVRTAGNAAVIPQPRPQKRISDHPDEDESLCDVLSSTTFMHEVTEAFIESVPSLTGTQIVQLRRSLVTLAQKHNWVED